MTTRCTKTDYDTFRQMLASYGFIHCPITATEFAEGLACGLTVDEMYGVTCDVNAGLSYRRAEAVALCRVA